MKIIAFAGFLLITIYLPFLRGGAAPPAVQPTHTPTPAASATNTPVSTGSPQPTGTPTSTSSPEPTETPVPTTTPPSIVTRRINAPFVSGSSGVEQAAVAWFGQVNSTNNYADIRVFHTDQNLRVLVNSFDRRLWYDTSPTPGGLQDWDAVSLYVDLGGSGDLPTLASHRFVAQLNNSQDRSAHQAAYRGDGSGWALAATDFTSRSGWRGDGLNSGAEARGWAVSFAIPFTSLGLSGPPAVQEQWEMALVLHDRDDASGTAIPVQTWPENVDVLRRSTWGRLSFGIPAYAPPPTAPGGSTTVRHGLAGASVPDAHVGGHFTCGQPFWPTFFDGWGDANYAGTDQINIQNQWDVADWPCFSKYYVTFPLDAVPAGKVIISGSLTLHLFGNSGQGANPGPEPSLIQVLAVDRDWNENTLTWNNAPLARENISSTWVDPLEGALEWPGVPYTWDVSRAVADAYARNEPLRLVLYSADTAMHSGKYFSSSDTGDWNAAARPSLSVAWGDPVSQATR